MAASAEVVEPGKCRDRSSLISSASSKFKGHKIEYSHKMTEKRRRDRMNISMSEIAQLLPTSSVSKQLEKAEILEKTITYIKKLQEITGKQELKAENKPDNPKPEENQDATTKEDQAVSQQSEEVTSNYYSGFRDCIKEVFHCLTNVEAMDLQQPCFQRLMGHLQNELQFNMSENAQRGDSVHDHQGTEQDKHLSTTSNGGVDNLLSSKSHHDSWRSKRSHESIENTVTQHEATPSEKAAKRAHIDHSSDGIGSSLFPQRSESNLSSLSGRKKEKKEKEMQAGCLGAGNLCGANGSLYSNMESCVPGLEKEKGEVLPSSNIFDRPTVDAGNGCGNEAASGNHKWINNGLDMPILATPISPRTPYIPNPYTAPTYALHPSGTHYIPVVLHLNIPLPPFSEMNARMNSAPNGYVAALNCMRMGSHLQYPYFPYSTCMPFATPHVLPGGMMGMNGIRNPKQEPTEKQCESKSRDVDSSTIDIEHTSVNECGTTDKLY